MSRYSAVIGVAIVKLEEISRLQQIYGGNIKVTIDGTYIDGTLLTHDDMIEIDRIVRSRISRSILKLSSEMSNQCHISLNDQTSVPLKTPQPRVELSTKE